MAYVSIEKTKILPFNFQLEEVHEILEKIEIFFSSYEFRVY